MDDGQYSALLPLPSHPRDKLALDLRPRAIRRWLADLPLASVGWTSGSIYEALKALNRTPLKATHRLRLLELLRPIFGYAVLNLRKRYVFREIPLPPRSAEVRVLVSLMLNELIAGYRQVADALLVERPPRYKRHLALALQRMTRCYSGLIIESFRFYEPAPAGAWRAAHEIYRLAGAQGVDRLSVPDDGITGTGNCSVSQAHAQLLLLSLAGPYHLRHQELDGAFVALKDIAARVTLRESDLGTPSLAAFHVRLDADEGPYRTLHAYDPGAHWLDVPPHESPAAARRTAFIRRRQGETPPPELVERLLQPLTHAAIPRPQRQPGGDRLAAVVGLHRISQMLGEQRGLVVESVAEDELWEFDTVNGRWRRAERQKNEPSETPAAEHEAVRSVEVVDRSAGGYSLRANTEPTMAARVGDVIGLRRLDDDADVWQVGFIKWLRNEPTGLRLGVQLLARQPLPVLIRPRSDSPEEKPSYSLMLPEVTTTDSVFTLLTPQRNLAPNTRILVNDDGAERDVMLVEELTRTSSCQRFEFTLEPSGDDRDAPAPEQEESPLHRLYAAL